MSEVLLFSAGSVLFVITTTATLLFGYHRFNELYGPEQLATQRVVAIDDGPTTVYAGDADSGS